MRYILALIEVDESMAAEQDMDTMDYFCSEMGWVGQSGISVTDARILICFFVVHIQLWLVFAYHFICPISSHSLQKFSNICRPSCNKCGKAAFVCHDFTS